jgi:hypothetical protein
MAALVSQPPLFLTKLSSKLWSVIFSSPIVARMGLDAPQPMKRITIKRGTPKTNMRVIVLFTSDFDFKMIGTIP